MSTVPRQTAAVGQAGVVVTSWLRFIVAQDANPIRPLHAVRWVFLTEILEYSSDNCEASIRSDFL